MQTSEALRLFGAHGNQKLLPDLSTKVCQVCTKVKAMNAFHAPDSRRVCKACANDCAKKNDALKKQACLRIHGPSKNWHDDVWQPLGNARRKEELAEQKRINAAEKNRTDQREVRNPRSNPTRMYVDGQYIETEHPSHRPGNFLTWGDAMNNVPASTRASPPYTPPEGPPTTTSLGMITRRRGQPQFAKAVHARDGQRCVFTGSRVSFKTLRENRDGRTTLMSICVAAHIKAHAKCVGDEYMDLDNGLTMRADVHAAFDAALFYITDEGLTVRWFGGIALHPLALTAGQKVYVAHHRAWVLRQWDYWS